MGQQYSFCQDNERDKMKRNKPSEFQSAKADSDGYYRYKESDIRSQISNGIVI